MNLEADMAEQLRIELELEKYKQKNLLLIKNKRNKLAHLGSINSTWSEVDQIIDVALKLHMK